MSSLKPARPVAIPVSIEDAELVLRAVSGDAWAKEALFRRHVRAVTGTVVRLLGGRDPSEAEDIVQDTFVVAFSQLARLRDGRVVRSWLLQIAVRRVYRRLKRRRLLELFGFETEHGELALMVERGASPEVMAELALIDGVLAELPIDQRVAWMLRHVEGEALEDIAVILECSLATVKRRIRAADEAIAVHVGGEVAR
jgi:RNA polymerase sigma-70 factor (ECF subfamily)